MAVSKEEALYIGDSPVDIKTARNAKTDLICVGWGFKTKEELTKEEKETTLLISCIRKTERPLSKM